MRISYTPIFLSQPRSSPPKADYCGVKKKKNRAANLGFVAREPQGATYCGVGCSGWALADLPYCGASSLPGTAGGTE